MYNKAREDYDASMTNDVTIKHRRGMIYRVTCPDGKWYTEPTGRRQQALDRLVDIDDNGRHVDCTQHFVEFSVNRGKTWDRL